MAKQNDKFTTKGGDSGQLSVEQLKEKLKVQQEINDALGYESSLQQQTAKIEMEKLINSRELSDLEQKLNNAIKFKNQFSKRTINNLKQQLQTLKATEKSLDAQLKVQKKQEESIKKQIGLQDALRKGIVSMSESGLKSAWTYLMDADKAIKGLTLDLGLSGKNANTLSNSMQGAAMYASNLGASMGDLASEQKAYSDETQRTVSLTTEQFKMITNIGKGTSLGVEEAGKLVGQFDLLGVSVQKTEGFVQGVVDTSERMGINASKVLKNIGSNFKRLNTFSFKDGIKGMAKMSQYSEKFRISMESALDSAKTARTLEGAIEMASQLNVLGGEFAKTDPLEMLNLSRNDPAKYTKKIAELTKGMASLNKVDDKFQIAITPQDQDRLEQAAKALGLSNEQITEMALNMKKVQLARQQMLGLNIDPKDREAIESLAKLDEGTGKMYAMINGRAKNISELTSSDIKLLKQEQSTLAERAKASQTFDEELKNTVMQLKSALLPLLKTINSTLEWFRDIKKSLGEGWIKGISYAAVTLMTAGFAFGKAMKIAQGIKAFKEVGGIGGVVSALNPFKGKGGAGAIGGAVTNATGGLGGGGAAGGGVNGAGGFASGGAAKSIAAIGVAAAGIGVGVGAAALGISQLAKAFKELDPKQIDGLNKSLLILGGIMVGTLAIGLIAVGGAAGVAAPELIALGVAVALIGAGIGVAAASIGAALWGVGEAAKGIGEGFKMGAEGVATLFNTFKSVSPAEMLGIAGGIYAIGGAMAALGAGGILSVIGGGGALAMILAIASQADNITKVGDAFKNIGVVMNTSAAQFERVESAIKNIASVKMDSNSMFSQLKDLLSKPLRVEFDKKEVALRSDVTLMINGNVLAKNLEFGKTVPASIKNVSDGKYSH